MATTNPHHRTMLSLPLSVFFSKTFTFEKVSLLAEIVFLGKYFQF
jgi:hypothetical protein